MGYLGKLNGLGSFRSSVGETYVGEWMNGKMNGEGLYIFANGNYRCTPISFYAAMTGDVKTFIETVKLENYKYELATIGLSRNRKNLLVSN